MPEKWGKKIEDSDVRFCNNFLKEYSKSRDINGFVKSKLNEYCNKMVKEKNWIPNVKDFDHVIQKIRGSSDSIETILKEENIKKPIEKVSSVVEISKFLNSEKELKNHLEMVRNRACSIDPEDIQDEKLRKTMEESCKSKFIMDLERFRDHALDIQTCVSQTSDIEDERKALTSFCLIEMEELSNKPDFIRKAIDIYGKLFQAETVPDVIDIFQTVKDPLKREEMVGELNEKNNNAIFKIISQYKFKTTNPIHKKIDEAKKSKRRKISEKTKDKIWKLINKEKDWSLYKIAQEVGVSFTTVRNVALERMSDADYKERFQIKVVKKAIKDKIWKLINKEKDWSQDKIAREVGVSPSTVRKVALERMSDAEYEKRFQTVSEETKDKIMELINEKKGWSQKKIAQEVGVSRDTVRNVALEKMTDADYEKRFKTVSEETKDKIMKLINEMKDWSQEKIAQEVGVSLTAVQNVARKRMSDVEYEKRFLTVSKETKDKIMKLINEKKDWSQEKIALEVGVSPSTVKDVALKRMTKSKYKDRFPIGKDASFGILFHKKITSEVVNWGRKRGIRVLREKEIPKKIFRFKEIRRQPDNAIYVDDNFRKTFPIPIPPHIKYIVLDFSFGISQENFLAKVERKHQSKDTIFYFIPIDPTDPKNEPKIEYQIPEDVPYRENIDALTLEQFFSTFNFTEKERKNIIDHFWDIKRKLKSQKDLQDFV